MREFIVAFVGGLVFAIGLGVSGMTDANNVIAFLDLAGQWDYGLAFVMGGAIAITMPAYAVYKRYNRSLLGGDCTLPKGGTVDKRLLTGAALFGLGWGLGGYCPGPALVSAPSGDSSVVIFVVAMIAGAISHDRLWLKWSSREAQEQPSDVECVHREASPAK